MSVDWNLDDAHFSEFPIIQIKFVAFTKREGEDSDFSQLEKLNPVRLFILCHRIANYGIPAIFTETIPSYLIPYQSHQIDHNKIPSIIIFDLDKKFEMFCQNESLPTWTEVNQFIWSISNPSLAKDNSFFDICEEFFDNLQEALTLKIYYQYYFLKPLYFTTYILIRPQTDIVGLKAGNEFNFNSIIEPAIVKPVPSFSTNYIQIRWVVQNNLSCIVNPRTLAKVGSFILFPPFRYPLYVTSIIKEKTRIEKNSLFFNNKSDNKTFATVTSKTNSKAIPIPITKGTVNRPVTPIINNFTYQTEITITALTIDKERTVTFKIPQSNDLCQSVNFVLLTKPPILLHYFFFVKNSKYEYHRIQNYMTFQQKSQNSKAMQPIQPSVPQPPPQFCDFGNTEIFDFTEKDIGNFFIQHFSEESAPPTNMNQEPPEIVVSFIEDTLPTPKQLITEQVGDKKVKKRISKTVDSILLRFNPNVSIAETFASSDEDSQMLSLFTQRIDLELPKMKYINTKCFTFFNFLNFSEFLGRANPCIQPISRLFGCQNIPEIRRIGIPDIFINKDGTKKEVKADKVFSSWEAERYMPIYGPKNCHYIVFYESFSTSFGQGNFGLKDKSVNLSSDPFPLNENDMINEMINSDSLLSFFKEVTNSYAQFSFGELVPYPKESLFIPVKLQPLEKVSIDQKMANPNSNGNDVLISKAEIDVDSLAFECESMKRAVFSFLNISNKEKLIELQQFPLIAFVVGGPACHFFTIENERKFKNSNDQIPHLHTVYVNPDLVVNHKSKKIQSLCFEIYSMMRSSRQECFGNIPYMFKLIDTKTKGKQAAKNFQIKMQQAKMQPSPALNAEIKQLKNILMQLNYYDFFQKLFFGFRYQPPFVLKKESYQMEAVNEINLSVVWDRIAGVAVWINDTGDILYIVEAQNFEDIYLMIVSSRSYPKHVQPSTSPLVKNISLVIFNEYLSVSHHEKYMEILQQFQNVDIFTIYPAPSVQVRFNEDFNDDVVVFEPPEIDNGVSMIVKNQAENQSLVFDIPANPEASCYVLSQHHQAYKVSVYKGGGKEKLFEFVKSMSYLSWLSVKPGYENRTSSLPPHVNALIQINKINSSYISQFEFLSTDCDF